MRVAILDDCPHDITELRSMLSLYFEENNILANIHEFNFSKEFLANFEANYYDIAFIDIYLNDGDLDGMEVATQIYTKDTSCRLIFSTVSQTHAVASYAVRASYYLTKPMDYTLLRDAMDIVCNDLLWDNRYIVVNIASTNTFVLLKDIIYVDCMAKQTRIHLKNNSLEISNKVADIFEQLSVDERFLPCNKNITVNMDYIINIQDNDFLLQNGTTVPIRQRGKKEIRKLYLEYSVKNLKGRN